MPVHVVDICPRCGRRNESPDLGAEELLVVARLQQLLEQGVGNPLCPDCQGVRKGDGTAAGEVRARANRSS